MCTSALQHDPRKQRHKLNECDLGDCNMRLPVGRYSLKEGTASAQGRGLVWRYDHNYARAEEVVQHLEIVQP